ncbi:unnamed protein product, partial [Heterotrigona itama]
CVFAVRDPLEAIEKYLLPCFTRHDIHAKILNNVRSSLETSVYVTSKELNSVLMKMCLRQNLVKETMQCKRIYFSIIPSMDLINKRAFRFRHCWGDTGSSLL